MRIEQLAADWLVFKEAELSAATRYTYRRIIASAVLSALSGDVASIGTIDLQAILMKALTSRSANEALKTRAVLRGMFGYAYRMGLVGEDVSVAIRLPSGTGSNNVSIRRVPSPAEAKAVSRELPAGYRLMPLLAAFAGLRWQEVAALRPDDLDVESRTITVERAVGRYDGIKEPKSAAGTRKTIWAEEINHAVQDHLFGSGEWLFTTATGSLLHYSNWRRRVWLPACDRAELAWTFHQYRHTFAVESLRRGRSVQSVAAMMGHSNPRITWEIYAGLFDDHLEEARQTW